MKSSRVKKFFSYYRPYLPLFSAIMLSAFLVAGITLTLPLITRYITKTVLEGGAPDALQKVLGAGGLMLLLIILHTLLNYFVDYQGHAVGAKMERDMRAELFDHLQTLSFRFYDEQRTGQLMSRITNDLLNLAEFFHHAPEDYAIYLVKFVGALVILFNINAQLALIVFLFLPVLAAFTLYFNKVMRVVYMRNRQRIADVNAQVEDSLAGIRVVASFANEAAERAKFHRENNRFLASRIDVYRNEAVAWQGVGAMTQLMSAAVVVVAGASIASGGSIVGGALDLADLLTFLLYIGALIEPVQRLSHMTNQLQDGLTGFDRYMEILEIEPEIQDAPGAQPIDGVQGRVAFENVSFQYREGHDYVLKNISLSVEAGEYIALVGSSGVGKTTLCSLIPRFYEVSEGRITLDGKDIRKVTLASLRASVGVVQQDVYLFAGTVYDNILYGKPNASREEVIAAAKRANAHDFILSLPNGYDTDIGQRGVKLSGGQKQRLSIARVFLKDPPVLIFDEATSSLDNESEKVVQESLEALARNRTTLVIAHRLSTIRRAGRIVVLTDRGIEEQGTHEYLLSLGGTYARLYTMQFDHGTPKAELAG